VSLFGVYGGPVWSMQVFGVYGVPFWSTRRVFWNTMVSNLEYRVSLFGVWGFLEYGVSRVGIWSTNGVALWDLLWKYSNSVGLLW
jgi:hypothetical protein